MSPYRRKEGDAMHRLWRALSLRERWARGQATVELALLLPVLLTMTMGVVDFGRALNAWVVMQNAAREGAFYAAKNPLATTTDVTNVVLTEAAPLLSTNDVSITDNLNVQGPSKIDGLAELSDQVIVTYKYHLVTPILFNGIITLTAAAAAPEGT